MQRILGFATFSHKSRNLKMYINPDDIFAKVEEERESGELSKTVTSAKLRYQASCQDGLIEQFNTDTGERKLGIFSDGVFIPINEK